MGRTAKLTKDIIDYYQYDGESLYETWERFKDLQRHVPHHRLVREHVLQIFYNGLGEITRSTIDLASGGSLKQKTLDKANELIEKLAMVSSNWSSERRRPPAQKALMKLDQSKEFEAMKAMNASLQSQVDALKKQVTPQNAPVAYVQVGCEHCGDFNHGSSDCYATGQAWSEQVNYVEGQRQENDPYSNTYNSGWRNHPNFGWRNQEGQGNAQGSNQAGPSFQGGNRPPQQQGNYHHNQGHGNNSGARPQHPPGFQPQRNMDEGNTFAKLMKELREMKQLQKNQVTTNQMLETQISQLDINLQGRPQGGLPSTTENNPREHVKAVEPRTRSSQELPKECEEVVIEVEEPYVRPPPPPPLADALREMLQYGKFLKDIITNKRSWDSGATVSIPEVCSSIILNDLPAKLKDTGSFSIPCTIRNMSSINCLCDLGASINLMPLTLFRTLCGDQTVKSTSMVLQLADHSLKRPFGIVEDVLVKTRYNERDVNFHEVSKVTFHSDELDNEYSDEDELNTETLITNVGVTPPSSQVPPQVEMKPLPPHLRYTFVGENETLPIIISDKLSKDQERRVVQVVKEHVLAIGWQISDIRGISPQIVMHKIHLEDESKKSTQR
ncbi:uncharacterized protein LOC126668261 [Mercurialis annua]|uniref:uncharacterized protein LOC126668261 n=1 Tax=Mercurialis annua TaxID=3986 RepID=UPI00215FD60A|nr:uncharacterized protein LOC126668261 [Mercurialis annua]